MKLYRLPAISIDIMNRQRPMMDSRVKQTAGLCSRSGQVVSSHIPST
jgi:hypothetical protein